jgi:hypothetical protein
MRSDIRKGEIELWRHKAEEDRAKEMQNDEQFACFRSSFLVILF